MKITWRLTLWYTIALVLVLAVILAAVFFGMKHLLVNQAEQEVVDAVGRIEALAGTSEGGNGSHVHIDLDDPELTQVAGSPVLWVQITGPDGVVQRSRSLGQATLPSYVGPPVERQIFGEQVILYGRKLPWGSVQVARPLTQEYRFLFSLLRLSLLLEGVGLGLAALGGLVLTRLALEPISTLTRTMLSIGPEDLNRRVELPGPKDELRALAQAFNHMLDQLEEGFRKQKEFMAAVSHDLRTPLTVIKSYAGLIYRWGKEDPQVVAEAAAAINRAAGLMERLVNDLLLLMRIQSPAGLRQEEIALDELVNEIVSDAAIIAEGVTVVKKEFPRVRVRGDRDYLRRAIWALVDNAIKYNRPGGRVMVSLAVVGEEARLEVADTGVGIPPTEINRIFDCFYRLDSAREQGKGFGIGLCLAKSIAEAHGGRIEVKSELGQGSTFTLILPSAPSP
ncbi:HAMP domain-containing sensor histidine kinase [Ammonifex thiophilus]|uniref:histidine kinase n=1 Tax=Ammonifex thiophilus TaxID=444093 RepID=A0A3D8P4H2_9THEO|nr:HAMP domain-containing sensor histidine kinase [Ammonifex thiophilus]RDV84035.1 sensor histidine kinase [Ammonifex thiophilus]